MAKFDIYKILTIIFSILIVGALGYLIYSQRAGTLGRGAVRADVEYGKASVIINAEKAGETPVYKEGLFAGDIEVALNGEQFSYNTRVSPAAGTEAVIKRDTGVSKDFSGGQNVWFTKSSKAGKYVSVISSNLNDVQVLVDGVEVGKAPLKFSAKDLLTQNENDRYKLTFKKDGYEEQAIEVSLMDGFELNISVDLFLNPVPSDVARLGVSGTEAIFLDFSKTKNLAYSDRQAWAKSINYWAKTRGSIATVDLKIDKFNFFLTEEGKFYGEDGSEVSASEVKIQKDQYVAYLGNSGNEGLSEAAKQSLATATGAAVSVSDGLPAVATGGKFQVEILTNTLGYLRVRDAGSTAGKEIGKAEIGKKYSVFEEKNGWYQIEYEAGKKGWISATYAKK